MAGGTRAVAACPGKKSTRHARVTSGQVKESKLATAPHSAAEGPAAGKYAQHLGD